MKRTEDFQEFYRAELLPHLEQLEGQRKQIVSRVSRAGMITAGLTVVLGMAMALLTPTPAIGFLAVFIGLIVYTVVYISITRNYKGEFKVGVIGRIIKFVAPGLSYHQDGHVSEPVYMGSRIFLTHPDRYRGEDLVRGMVGNTAIQFSELHTEYRTESTDAKGNRQEQWHTTFKGIFFVADFNKQFQGETVVLPDAAEKLLGRLGQKLQSLNFSRKGDLVRLEDVEFEKRFVVYSDDQIEARYLLSPGLMARITGFADRTGHAVHVSFVNSNIHVAISHDRNLFEADLFRSALDPKLAQEYLDDLMLAVSIVDDLNLNTRIWSKQ